MMAFGTCNSHSCRPAAGLPPAPRHLHPALLLPPTTPCPVAVMSEADTTSAYTQVQAALAEARKQAEQAAAAYGGKLSQIQCGMRTAALAC